MENLQIVPFEMKYVESYYSLFASVAHEGKYLGRDEPFAYSDTVAFLNNSFEKGSTMFVMLCGEKVVGWCDIQISDKIEKKGTLGIFIDKGYRSRGLGKKMLTYALDDARRKGLIGVELFVRSDNDRARHVYAEFGFCRAEYILNALVSRGKKIDVIRMTLAL